MRYIVDVAELRRSVDLLTRALLGRRGSVARHLEQVSTGVPPGLTTRTLHGVTARWRSRGRRMEAGLVRHAEHVAAASDGYEQVEADAADAVDKERP